MKRNGECKPCRIGHHFNCEGGSCSCFAVTEANLKEIEYRQQRELEAIPHKERRDSRADLKKQLRAKSRLCDRLAKALDDSTCGKQLCKTLPEVNKVLAAYRRSKGVKK